MHKRIVFLGDSITDGHTLILHVEQSLSSLGMPADCFNCGIGGDRADQMLGRLDRDVLSLRPTSVCLSAGINDALQGVAPAVYQTNIAAIISRLTEAGIELLVM